MTLIKHKSLSSVIHMSWPCLCHVWLTWPSSVNHHWSDLPPSQTVILLYSQWSLFHYYLRLPVKYFVTFNKSGFRNRNHKNSSRTVFTTKHLIVCLCSMCVFSFEPHQSVFKQFQFSHCFAQTHLKSKCVIFFSWSLITFNSLQPADNSRLSDLSFCQNMMNNTSCCL